LRETVPIGDWASVVAAFEAFFDGAGTVIVGDDRVSFAADSPPTGLTVDRSGALTASMPLHGLEGVVETVTFDDVADEVVLQGQGLGYVYRVPPGLRPADPAKEQDE
jgi:hypothetical protein